MCGNQSVHSPATAVVGVLKIFTQTAPEPLDPAGARKTAIGPLGIRVKNKLGEEARTIYMMGAAWSVE